MARAVAWGISIFLFVQISYSQLDTGSSITPKLDSSVSANRIKAKILFQRLAGIKIAIDHPILDEMEMLIQQGNMAGAAEKATAHPGFINNTVRDFAAVMSTRDESVSVPLNDFVATVMGVVKDNKDARELLTASYTYRSSASTKNDLVSDIVKSNGHYSDVINKNLDISQTLVISQGIAVVSGTGDTSVLSPQESAGVLSSRTFMEAHTTAGTNRRPIEFAFREFLCKEMREWADAAVTDAFVRRDVSRTPDSVPNTFQSKCSTCHRVLDALSPAYATFDFEGGFLKVARLFTAVDETTTANDTQMRQVPVGISAKLNQNTTNFPSGYAVNNDSWVNLANQGANKQQFGWRGPASGTGLNAFGRMLASSDAFPRCMARRAFKQVCARAPADFDVPMLNWAANQFMQDGYNLRKLFERIATRSECIGE